jgi:hypothetical protein
MESCWANDRPAYRCRHGQTSAVTPGRSRPGNTYIREDHILPHLPAMHARLTAAEPAAGRRRRRTRHGIDIPRTLSDEEMASGLRARQITLTYDPRAATLRADTPEAITAIIGRTSQHPGRPAPASPTTPRKGG